jgi:hypothetical protein
MKNFYSVTIGHWEDYQRDRVLYCKTRKQAVDIVLEFLLYESSNTYDGMMYILWRRPIFDIKEDDIYDIKDADNCERFKNDIIKHFENNNSIVAFGNPGIEAYVDYDQFGCIYIECVHFEDSDGYEDE